MSTATKGNGTGKRLATNSAIVLSFVVALEFVIMISPFAFVFYAAMNPFLLALNQSALTRWLTAFFLPHMVVPPNAFLKGVRVLGSAAFLSGMAVFVICAAQVYAGKLLRPGVAHRGLYSVIRHPQYVGLAVAAWGLAVMWPRFLTVTLFAVMLFLYYLLARDEERRMAGRFGESYRAYLERTGMFVPRSVERLLGRRGGPRPALTPVRAIGILLGLLVVCAGGGFALRAYTVRYLPLAQVSGVDTLTITTEDFEAAKELVASVVAEPAVASKLQGARGGAGDRVLAYFIPIDYIMQGMIADTGPEWKLFQHHRTFRMIAEYIIHPFAHVAGGHQRMAGMMHHDPSLHNSAMMKRRIIFLHLSAGGRALTGAEDDFGINVRRAPMFFVDVHLHTGEVLQVQDLASGSGWGTVPTPMF
ncbi:MAG TPA: isoprenylcysteine carboxylmethyltransferase family protein [Terriglobia bacterium]|nr:isoprenylcysteine carboxylmethyltransferase family protein [Terriglobia bacterium]